MKASVEETGLTEALGVFTAATLQCKGNLSAVMKGPEAWHGRRK